MCVAERRRWFRYHGSFAKAPTETSRRPLAEFAMDHDSREDACVVISKET